MGKRKSSSKPQGPKKRDPLPTVFTCLFCNHEKSVSVKLDKKLGIGSLECKICGQKFQCGVNYLSAPVDVYGEWVDAADNVADNSAHDDAPRSSAPGRSMGRSSQPSQPSRRVDDDEDDMGYEGDGIVADDIED